MWPAFLKERIPLSSFSTILAVHSLLPFLLQFSEVITTARGSFNSSRGRINSSLDTMSTLLDIWTEWEEKLGGIDEPVLVISKDWEMLVTEPRFQELCARNGGCHDYLFLWREVWSEHIEEPLFVRELSFLDVEARQWHSIPTTAFRGFETRCMYMNDGLVCKLVSKSGGDNISAAAIPNRVSRMTRIVPVPPEYFRPRQLRPTIVPMDQDNPTDTHKTFLITNLHDDHKRQLPQQLYVHDSDTDDWHGILQNQPYVVKSVVTLQGTLYITSDHSMERKGKWRQGVMISKYNPMEDEWDVVLRMAFGNRTPVNSRLLVARKRLFVVVQLGGLPDHIHVDPELGVQPVTRPFTIGRPGYSGSLQEMYEVYYGWNNIKRVVQFDCCQIRHMFGEEIDDPEIFPSLDSDSNSAEVKSCLLVSLYSGQIRKYTLATGSVDVLPQHPLLPGSDRPTLLGRRHGLVRIFHGANDMLLSFRNLDVEPDVVNASSSTKDKPK